MQRRTFIKTLLAGGTAAIATQFNVTQSIALDIEKELTRDLHRVTVAMPGDPETAVWYSIAPVVDVWVDQLTPQAKAIEGDAFKPDVLRRSLRTLARAIDLDLRTAKIKDDQKVIVDIPMIRKRTSIITSSAGGGIYEIVGGVESKASIFGNRVRVGHIGSEAIIT
jgi:hypothetical protein